MINCAKCKNKIGMFSTYYLCDKEDCERRYCENCSDSRKECDTCEYKYCSLHSQHDCDEYTDEQYSEDEEEDITTIIGNFATIDWSYDEDLIKTLKELNKLKKQGFKIKIATNEPCHIILEKED